MPSSLEEALEALEADEFMAQKLGKRFMRPLEWSAESLFLDFLMFFYWYL